MRAGPSDTPPPLRLQAGGSHWAERHAHARSILSSGDGSRDWGHTYPPAENVTYDTRANPYQNATAASGDEAGGCGLPDDGGRKTDDFPTRTPRTRTRGTWRSPR